jgi:SNF2 family DNA or RNA helicase
MLAQLWASWFYKSYQETAIRWMLHQESLTPRGGLMCDDMGLGKTTSTLGLILNSPLPSSMSRHTLLICPKAVISQWRDMALKCSFNVVEPFEDGWKKPSPFYPKKPWLYIVNYHALLHRPSLFKQKWGRLCIDEAHEISKTSGAFYKAIKKIDRSITWCITATPSKNDKSMGALKEIRALFTVLGFDPVKLLDPAYISHLIQTRMIHRSMEEMRPIIKELPPLPTIRKTILPFESMEEEEFYKGIQGRLVAQWRALEKDNVTGQFQLIMKLRQLSIHPQIYISAKKRESVHYNRENWDGTSTKFEQLKKIIEKDTTPTRWIVFCQFRDEMELLEHFLYDSESIGRIHQYHGGINIDIKDKIIAATKEPIVKHEILLLQLQSGGVGLNLQHFTKIAFISPWWTQALMNQAIARAVRMGQKEIVEVHLLMLAVEDSINIDDMMMGHADVKGQVLREVLSKASRGEILSKAIEDGIST